tara:strand:- start:408 stop:902 length:495 start_codon:yes stop_codon:yes gene_type:complete
MILKNLENNFLRNLLIIFFIFLTDRISKIYIIHLDKLNNNSEIFLSKFLNIRLFWNEGIAFGLLSFGKEYLYNSLTIIIFIVILIIYFMAIKNKGVKKYFFLMILGGAIGNFYDRVIYKAVPDFIDFHIGNYHWFIFNIADIFITLGVIFMIFSEFFSTTNNDE